MGKRMEEERLKEEEGGRREKAHLHQSPLNLSIGRSTLTKPPTSNSIDFIHENNTWFVFFCIGKHLSNHSCGFTNVFVDNLILASCERSEKRVARGMTRCSLEDYVKLERTERRSVDLGELWGKCGSPRVSKTKLRSGDAIH